MKQIKILLQLIVWVVLTTFFYYAKAQEAEPSAGIDNAQKISVSDSGYIADEVDRMKDEVLNRKAQMQLLKYLIRNEGVNASYPLVEIYLTNEMSTRYQLFSLNYTIDGDSVYNFSLEDYMGSNNSDVKPQNFKTNIAPGTHMLKVQAVYKGNDSGVFSYINDYKVKIESATKFQVDKAGGGRSIQIVAFEKGWMMTDFKDRPDLKINVSGSMAQAPLAAVQPAAKGREPASTKSKKKKE